MKLGIGGAVSLVLGLWALKSWWWFAAEVVKGLVAVALVIGGVLALAIAVRKACAKSMPGTEQTPSD